MLKNPKSRQTIMLLVSFVGTVCIMTAGVVSFSTPRPLLSSPRVLTSARHRHNNRHPLVVKDNKVTALNAVIAIISPPPPSWAIYTIGHIIGGTTGTPFVLRATQSWYKRIALPSWTPPNYIFGPVWTTLYGLMGYSLSRIISKSCNVASTAATTTSIIHSAIKLWTVHYTLNLLWSPTFFGMKRLRLGLIINLCLVTTLIALLPLYYSIDPLSAYLLLPYLAWLLFATVLNQAICKLNPTTPDGKNEAMIQADICNSGPGYNDAMLRYDIEKLQLAAAKYAGL